MTAPVSLAEARVFLRVAHGDEDELIQTLLEAASTRVERALGEAVTDQSPAPVRLAILMLALAAYERGEAAVSMAAVEPWLAPYRTARL